METVSSPKEGLFRAIKEEFLGCFGRRRRSFYRPLTGKNESYRRTYRLRRWFCSSCRDKSVHKLCYFEGARFKMQVVCQQHSGEVRILSSKIGEILEALG